MNQGQYSAFMARMDKLIEIQDENRRLLQRIDRRLKTMSDDPQSDVLMTDGAVQVTAKPKQESST